MTLFKYLPPERVDVLLNSTIRITQPSALNDKHEALPNLTALVSDEMVDQVLQSYYLENLDNDALNGIRQAPVYKKYSDEILREILAKSTPFLKDFLTELVHELNRGLLREILPNHSTLLRDFIDPHLGVLSLTDNPSSMPMWAHYAKEHEGFVLGFNGTHPMFHPRENWAQHVGYPIPVEYFNEKPCLTILDVISVKALFSKHVGWSEEREWRIVLPLAECIKGGNDPRGNSVHLFSYPRNMVRYVVLGANISNSVAQDICDILRNHEEYKTTLLYRAHIDAAQFDAVLILESRFTAADFDRMRESDWGALVADTSWLGLALTKIEVPTVAELDSIIATYAPLLTDDDGGMSRSVLEAMRKIPLPQGIFNDKVHACLILHSGMAWVKICIELKTAETNPPNSSLATKIKNAALLVDLEGMSEMLKMVVGDAEFKRLKNVYGEPQNIPEVKPQSEDDVDVQEAVEQIVWKAVFRSLERVRDVNVYLPVPRAILSCPDCNGGVDIRFKGGKAERVNQDIGLKCNRLEHLVDHSIDAVEYWGEDATSQIGLLRSFSLLADLGFPWDRMWDGTLTEEERNRLLPYLRDEGCGSEDRTES